MKKESNSINEVPEIVLKKWQEIADLLAELFSVPAALIMRAENEYMEVFVSSDSESNPYSPGDKEQWYGLYCETVIKTQKKLVIPDATLDPQWNHNPDLKLGMICYMGVPINYPDNSPFGTLCVLDRKEHNFSDKFHNLLLRFKNVIEFDIAFLQTYNKKTESMRACSITSERVCFCQNLQAKFSLQILKPAECLEGLNWRYALPERAE